jgi:hypothetical protein
LKKAAKLNEKANSLEKRANALNKQAQEYEYMSDDEYNDQKTKKRTIQYQVSKLFKKMRLNSSQDKKDINEIVSKNENIIIPSDITEVPSYKNKASPNSAIAKKIHKMDRYKAFKEYFKSDLMEFIDKPSKKPKLRAFVPGGYGLKMVFENKYGKSDAIQTYDLDITVSVHDSVLSVKEAKDYLIRKCKRFISLMDEPEHYKIQKMDFPVVYNPLLKMARYHLISIYYKDEEFVDMVITDREIKREDMNIECSHKSVLPIKKDDGYFHEYFQIIYMENVPGVDNYCYLKRNPVTGKFSCKGIKDINRISKLCSVSDSKNYKRYCDLVKKVDTNFLKKMNKEDRDKIFVSLKNIIT